MSTIHDVKFDSEDDEDYAPSGGSDDDEDGRKKKIPKIRSTGAAVISDDDDDAAIAEISKNETTTMPTSKRQEIDDLFNSLNDEPRVPARAASKLNDRDAMTNGKHRSGGAEAPPVAAGPQKGTGTKKKRKVLNWWEQPAKPTAPKPKPAAKPTKQVAAEEEERVVVEEVREYAGKQIIVKNEVAKSSKAAKKDNLDKLLDMLGPTKKLTTMDKSRLDWDISKKEEGDEEELRKFTEDGFVAKQRFLNETDLRQFELEKRQREIQRIKAAKAQRR